MRRKAAKYRDFRRIGSCIKNAIFQGMRGCEGECAGAASAAFDFFAQKIGNFGNAQKIGNSVHPNCLCCFDCNQPVDASPRSI